MLLACSRTVSGHGSLLLLHPVLTVTFPAVAVLADMLAVVAGDCRRTLTASMNGTRGQGSQSPLARHLWRIQLCPFLFLQVPNK